MVSSYLPVLVTIRADPYRKQEYTKTDTRPGSEAILPLTITES